MTRPQNLNDKLGSFTGTEQYYKSGYAHNGKELVYTDGVRELFREAGAYWLMDHIFPQTQEIYGNAKISADRKSLLVFKLKVDDEKSSAVLRIEDGNYGLFKEVVIEYTDFPALEQTVWVQNGVAMLTSEY